MHRFQVVLSKGRLLVIVVFQDLCRCMMISIRNLPLRLGMLLALAGAVSQ